jgi:hypothetical protein
MMMVMELADGEIPTVCLERVFKSNFGEKGII